MRTSHHTQPTRPAAERGFTLIELMVGVALGMLTVIVIAQVLAQSEARRRNVSMGGDADVNGSLSLFTLQRDIQMAGYGLAINAKALGCPIVSTYDGTAQANMTLAPVLITNGADGEPDSITVMRGNSNSTAVPVEMKATANYHYNVESTLGFKVNDQFITIPDNPSSTQTCQLFTVTSDNASLDTQITDDNIPHGSTDKWNAAQAAVAPKYLINVGTLARRTYMVTAAAPYTLRVMSRSPANGLESAEDLYSEIINMQALYGRDTDQNGTVDQYDTNTPTTAAGWQQIVSIRLALVARSNHFEKDAVTHADNLPKWDVGASSTIDGETLVDCGSSKCIELKVDHVPDWEHYRYKVFSTTIPLRNVLWTEVPK
jgi:type IV pilus assembly protein PilW